jgi:hypothetical protein
VSKFTQLFAILLPSKSNLQVENTFLYLNQHSHLFHSEGKRKKFLFALKNKLKENIEKE